jgi:hypothetical protein
LWLFRLVGVMLRAENRNLEEFHILLIIDLLIV